MPIREDPEKTHTARPLGTTERRSRIRSEAVPSFARGRYHVPTARAFVRDGRFRSASSDAPNAFARARVSRGDLMGSGGREHARAETTDATEAETVEKHTSALVGTVLASILWVLTFGDGDGGSVARTSSEEA